MTMAEVAKLLAFITAIYPNVDLKDGTVEAWFALLQDLNFEIARAAVKKVIAESEFPAIPPVGKIRRTALDFLNGYRLTAPEAWGLVLKAIKQHGYYGGAAALAGLPAGIAQVVQWMGWAEICHSEKPDVVRAQFMRMYEIQELRSRETAELPPGVKEMVKGLGQSLSLPARSDCKATAKEAV